MSLGGSTDCFICGHGEEDEYVHVFITLSPVDGIYRVITVCDTCLTPGRAARSDGLTPDQLAMLITELEAASEE